MKLTGKGFNVEAIHPELARLDLLPAIRCRSSLHVQAKLTLDGCHLLECW